MESRSNIISVLTTQAQRKKNLDDEKKEKYINEIKIKNKELRNRVNTLFYKAQNLSNTLEKLTNFALGAQASADSEYFFNNQLFGATNAVNGNSGDIWISTGIEESHWLKIDLLQPKNIMKFVIKHAGSKPSNTLDFEILGSNDDMTWDELVSVRNNKENTTIHVVTPCRYRLFKLHIIRSCEFGYQATITEFEAWGNQV